MSWILVFWDLLPRVTHRITNCLGLLRTEGTLGAKLFNVKLKVYSPGEVGHRGDLMRNEISQLC